MESENSTTKQGPSQENKLESGLGRLKLNKIDMIMKLAELDEQWESHYDRFVLFEEIDDINKAIKYASLVLEATPEDDPDKAARHGNLGISHDARFRRLDILDDLEMAIKHKYCAVASTPRGHPELSLRQANLGNSYNNRFERLGEMQDLERAIECHSHALELTPENHPHLPHRHTSLGMSYTHRFERLGEMHDLEKEIEHHTRALELTPNGDPHLLIPYANVGMSHHHRFRRLGETRDLEKAIRHFARSLELTPDDHPHLPDRHVDLGVCYNDKFRRQGEMNDLEKAVEHHSFALELTPNDRPSLSDAHANLGMSYTLRFQRLGEINDLEKAIEHDSRALELTPGDHPDLSRRHASLGASYIDRYQRLGEMDDIEKAIKHHSRALKLTPDGHPDLPLRHVGLGLSYIHQFRRLRKINALEKAIEHHSCAFELTPDSHPQLSDRHAAVGVSYTDRYEHLGEMDDLEKAIEHHSRALALTPDGHPDLPERYRNRAFIFVLQYQQGKDHAHLQNALHSYRRSSQLSTGAPRIVFQNALDWAERATFHGSLNCIEAYQTAIDLLPHFIWLGATTAQRYQDLSTVENLAINAAHAAILHSEPNLALEWLENARCVVWNQTLMLRTPLDQLRLSYPDTAFRLQTVSKQLHEAGSHLSTPHAFVPNSVNFEVVGRDRRRLAREYGEVLTEARALPGFEDFLRPMKAKQLVHAAQYRPIIVVNCHKARCDALVIAPGQDDVRHLPLPNFSAKEAQEARSDLEASLRRKGLRDRGVKARQSPGQIDKTEGVLLILWTYVVKPVLEFLDLIKDVPSDCLPHITWCPTGPLSFLPLHAAGDYSQPRARVFDHAVSSYIPTLTPLIVSTAATSLNPTPRLLAVSQTNTPGFSPLPGTAKELAYVRAHAQNNAEYSQLDGNEATISKVLDEMGKHDWVHLACHAHQNVEDPNKSGFFLHDGTLDLASINQQSFQSKGLAFLSACQTATGDEKLPDEAVHLASGMLMAGYTSVIATMWSVGDTDAPLVADKVYAQLMTDGKLGNGEAGRALHNAVGELRDKVGEKAFLRWVPYINIGFYGTAKQEPPQDRSFEGGLTKMNLDNKDMNIKGLDKQWRSHYNQFMQFGELDDIEKAIECATLALDSTPEGYPDLATRHGNLGISYDDRFRRLGKVDDLERAIEHGSHAVALIPEGHPNLLPMLGNLGNSYGNRFQRLGDITDLEKAISYDSRALALTADGHPDLSDRHANLGVSYALRFRRLGDVHDLEKAIEHDSRALKLTPDGHPSLRDRHANLGVSYTDRFQRQGEIHDLEKAIEHRRRAFELTPDGHPDLPLRHVSLGVSYRDRFQQLGEINDVEKAIEHDSRALELTPGDHPHLSRRHTNLGMSYGDRFRQLGEIHDLEEAIQHHSRSLELTPNGHPDLPDQNLNRAFTFVLQYQHTKDQAHLQSALHHYRKASQLSSGSPRSVFQNALKWANHASRQRPLNCIEAYQTTIDLLPHFISLGATTTQRYHDLSTVKNLAINAAHAAILHSELNLALEWLEHTRCVVWNQTLMLRTPLNKLQASHPDLAFRLQLVAKQLHESGTQISTPQALASDHEKFEQIGQNRRYLAREYSNLIAEARTLPECEDFLQPVKANKLIHAARYGPVVVINCHEDRSEALVVLPGQDDVKFLPLPNFTAKEAQRARSDLESSLRRKGLRDRGVKVKQPQGQIDMTESVLLTLWTHVVQPTLEFLEFIKEVPPNTLPHLTWCPTGPLSFLPLHAAGDYSQPQARVFDHVVSSYTPTLTSLLASTLSSLNPSPRLLAVSQTNTPGFSPLPGTDKELAYVKSHAQNNAEYSELVGNEATIATVLHTMAHHDWVHLACHAHQNIEDPNKSGFFLYDGTLDLASINRQSFKNKGLAFLSACQTATGDERLPDEAVHLASGMLMAGYTSVIGTMWSVGDTDAPLVADKVYAQLMTDGKLGNGEAGRALHDAVGELRGKVGEKAFWRWVPYIHIGS